jgi:hypothetical protein
MRPLVSVTGIVGSRRGQSLVELTLSIPLLLVLLLGGIEFSNIINNYLVLTHLTREGANLTSRGTDPELALDAIIAGANSVIRTGATDQGKVLYVEIVQDPVIPCPPTPCVYVVNQKRTRGALGESSKIGSVGAKVQLTGIDNVGPGQTFHAIEVFYDYGPSRLTPIENLIGSLGKIFYERTIFTDVS